MDDTRLLKDMAITKRSYLLKSFIYDVVVLSNEDAYAIIHEGMKVAHFTLDSKEVSFCNCGSSFQ